MIFHIIKETAKIYTLSDKFGNIFYVGATFQPIEKRLKNHIYESGWERCPRRQSRKCQRIRRLNFEITANVIHTFPVEYELFRGDAWSYWTRQEERKWIQKYLDMGCDLCNCITGKLQSA